MHMMIEVLHHRGTTTTTTCDWLMPLRHYNTTTVILLTNICVGHEGLQIFFAQHSLSTNKSENLYVCKGMSEKKQSEEKNKMDNKYMACSSYGDHKHLNMSV